MIRVSDVISALGNTAPPELQEDYDNSGLIIGDRSAEVRQALVCLDCTEEVVREAIAANCNLIIAHHPLIFKGKING